MDVCVCLYIYMYAPPILIKFGTHITYYLEKKIVW